uniref:DUF420 domain-containing protein n=1 Tax=uncultured bacterium A1Q1_fos_962 TaxID=1256592 RepID=L7VSS9_9BACT|nr:protein of unknown function DUF420 [uncultured bacterium A1Q1_fos_962]
MEWARELPHVNAALNGLATVLLILGYALIRQKREQAHRRVMLACFGVSVLFLLSYLTYHTVVRTHTPFPSYPAQLVRTTYYIILFSHIVLAALVPVMALVTIVLGLKDRRDSHRRWAKWTFPIWLYVSITGVIVYFMLYQLYPPQVQPARLEWTRVGAVGLSHAFTGE